MAGLGFKDFQVGEVLTSADVDGYLMQQSVMRFADAGARGSALGTATGTGVPLAEGMVSYLDDVDRLEIYNGTTWTSVGKVLQVVQAFKTDSFSTTSGTFVDVTGLSLSITPASVDSKVLLIMTAAVGNLDSIQASRLNLVRDSTAIAQSTGSSTADQTLGVYTASASSVDQSAVVYLDSPATTSATTYKVQLARGAGGTAILGRYAANENYRSVSSLIAVEVAA